MNWVEILLVAWASLATFLAIVMGALVRWAEREVRNVAAKAEELQRINQVAHELAKKQLTETQMWLYRIQAAKPHELEATVEEYRQWRRGPIRAKS